MDNTGCPSSLLFSTFSCLRTGLSGLLVRLRFPAFLRSTLIFNVCEAMTFVISIVLPPVTVFFPLFALLRSLKFLPHVTCGLSGPFGGYGTYNGRTLAVYVNFNYGTINIANYEVVSSPHRELLTILAGIFMPYGNHFPALVSIVAVFLIVSNNI